MGYLASYRHAEMTKHSSRRWDLATWGLVPAEKEASAQMESYVLADVGHLSLVLGEKPDQLELLSYLTM